MSADMNIDQGERSRGSWRPPIAGSEGGAAAGAGRAGGEVVAGWSDAADGAGVAG
jgi:hypothetical protein